MIYAIFSVLWIAFSDQVLLHFVHDVELLTRIQMIKGWAFVIITAGIVYFLLLRELNLVKKVEKALGNREKRLNILFDQASDAIYVADLDGKFIQFNRQACRSTGYNDEMLGQMYVMDLDVELNTTERYAQFVKELDSGIPLTFESQQRRRDGTIFPVEITAALLETPDGPQVLGIARDITERKKLLVEYGRVTQLATLGTVAAGVAHEINNPISGVINYATMIRNAPEDSARALDLSQRIIKEGERIARITRDLLHYSRESSYEMQVSDVRELTESAVSLVKKNISRHGIDIRTSFPTGLPEVPVYPQGIQQVIINLVDNAYDALQCKEPSSDDKLIEIKGYVEDSLVLEVYDNGIGMSREVMARARDAFFSTKPAATGTGLGLSIVSDIVARHQGELQIESREGEFSRFRVLLPLKSPDA